MSNAVIAAPDAGWGHLVTKEPSAVKVRLARVFKREGQSMLEIMNELKELSDKDMDDFRSWFAAAGYPCTGN